MGRSQRHKVIIQNTDSAGKGLSEKQPAPRYINQYANSQPFTVPVGPAGGPLQGSSVAGFPPVLIPPPTAQMNAELQAEGEFTDPGQFNLSGNPIYTSLPPADGSGGGEGEGGGGIDPEPGFEPTLTSLEPNTAVLGDPDVTMRCIGTNFTDSSVITFAGQLEPTTFVSPEEVTTGVKPSLGWGAVTVEVIVSQGGYSTPPLGFTFTEPAAGGETRSLPIPNGPVAIQRIELAGGNLLVTLGGRSSFRTGDVVRIEATGNSTVNGDYELGTVKSNTITLSAEGVDLLGTIEGRGRVTLLERG